MKKLLQDVLKERRLVCDLAQWARNPGSRVLANGDCGEAWNLAYPERVLKIQRNYAPCARIA